MSSKPKIDKYALNGNQKTFPLIKRIIDEYLKSHWKTLLLATFFMLISAGMTAAFAAIIEPVMDKVLIAGDQKYIWILSAGIFAIFFIRGFSAYFETILMSKIGEAIVATMQKQLFSHFMELDLKFFHQNPSGQLISRVTNDVEVVRGALTNTLVGFGKSILTLTLLIAVMFYQDWVLALASFTVFPFIALFVMWLGKRLRKMSGNIQFKKASLSSRLSQSFQGVRLVKSYCMEHYEKASAGAEIVDLRKTILKSVRISNLSTPVNETVVGAVVFGIIVYGGHQVAAGESTAGQLLSFITAFTMAYEPMKKLARLNNTLQMGLGATDRVFEMLDKNIEVQDQDGAVEATFEKPEITFDHVTFRYNADDEVQALKDISISIPAGKVTALVGRSGSGKTTIMNLIPRFFDVTEGQVFIDQHDVRNLTKRSLRSNISFVSQDITIFDDSASTNIGYGREGATQDDIIKAAIAAEADSFIRQLPQGYETKLGEDGVTLSGGQKQRISIARAILRDAPILLLDEATSALDNEVERAIQQTLSQIQEGRTTLIVAHRLSTIQNADKIIVMDKGEVAEQGDHTSLLALNGLYAHMLKVGSNQ